MGFNTSKQEFEEILNEFNLYILYFPEAQPKKLDQDETLKFQIKPKPGSLSCMK
jgi:hypothetical protein